MVEGLIANAVLLVVIMLALWALAARIGDVSFIDAVWGGAMALLALASWLQPDRPGARATLIMAMTVLWGTRLAIHLLVRWRASGEDARYARMLGKAREQGRYARAALIGVFAPQAVLLFVTCLPAQLGVLASTDPAPIGPLALAGAALWAVGLFFEAVGDWQLTRFRGDLANADKVMDKGLWRYTRHPNYFGDCCVWWGIWLAAAEAGWGVALASVAGPLFVTFTLTRWSGKPLLEKGLAKRRPGYAAYVARTSGFVPMPPRRG
jgi:steroid 5-alpha reductase family enzyme